MAEPSTANAVWLMAGREVRTRLRARSFVFGTAALVLALGAFVLVQALAVNRTQPTKVGISGQAIVLAGALQQTTAQLGLTVDTYVVDQSDGLSQVSSGQLDALVSGPPGALHVTVRSGLDARLRTALTSLVRQQALDAELAEAGLKPSDVNAAIAAVHVDVTRLTAADPDAGQRLAIGVIVVILLYASLILFGNLVAQGVVEEKSSRVVEVLLSTVRPWQLLLGKLTGLCVVGLIQVLIVSVIGLVVSAIAGVLSVPGDAFGALGAGLLWYLVGFFLYATVFAGAGSLVSRQEDLQPVVAPVIIVIAVAFVLGIRLLVANPNGGLATVLSLLPPFAPVLMPGRMAVGGVPGWQVLLALVLALAAIGGLTWLGGKIYANSVLRTGGRVKLSEALR